MLPIEMRQLRDALLVEIIPEENCDGPDQAFPGFDGNLLAVEAMCIAGTSMRQALYSK